ncbi:hypothetical protein [Dyadobacter sp. LHD-138]|uniref:hypothetical protein n=1 Tax=Dyadobacter sp. LHD-138 TaxID=3071413 RepID=UPI0027E20C4A|nr:hypothetical protein [Dyadobacter sp. LHD-138]MDQ6477195.1 hypothetical protein [Dyadobacter sp. LHD-138]
MINPEIQKTNQLGHFSNPDIECVLEYIKRVWNEKRFSEIAVYLDDHYIDHSMPYAVVQNQQGLIIYLNELAEVVSHQTEIVALTILGELVVCHVRISVSELLCVDDSCKVTEVFYGYRMFRMNGNKIAEHWEIL